MAFNLALQLTAFRYYQQLSKGLGHSRTFNTCKFLAAHPELGMAQSIATLCPAFFFFDDLSALKDFFATVVYGPNKKLFLD